MAAAAAAGLNRLQRQLILAPCTFGQAPKPVAFAVQNWRLLFCKRRHLNIPSPAIQHRILINDAIRLFLSRQSPLRKKHQRLLPQLLFLIYFIQILRSLNLINTFCLLMIRWMALFIVCKWARPSRISRQMKAIHSSLRLCPLVAVKRRKIEIKTKDTTSDYKTISRYNKNDHDTYQPNRTSHFVGHLLMKEFSREL